MRLENLRIWFGDRAARHEGSLRGKWYSFPLDEEKIREDFGKGLRKIQLFASEEFPPELCSKYYSIAELNSIYQSLKALDPVLLENLAELMDAGYELEDIERIGSDFYYYEGCSSMADVAKQRVFMIFGTYRIVSGVIWIMKPLGVILRQMEILLFATKGFSNCIDC